MAHMQKQISQTPSPAGPPSARQGLPLTLQQIANDLNPVALPESLEEFDQYVAFEDDAHCVKAVIFMDKDITPQDLAEALTHIKTQRANMATIAPENIMTDRERDVLNMFSRGLSYREAAKTLGLSTHTVNDYVKSIYRKLDVNSRNEAIFEAVQYGWVTL